MRFDGRELDQTRPVSITRHYIKHAPGSVLVEMGDTKVLCAATYEERPPMHTKGTGRGWITAEYAMLPRATIDRTPRERNRGRIAGRSQEIQRLIGRSLRSVVDMESLGECTIWIDCDVIQADGGTRTASITGAYVALIDLLDSMGQWEGKPLPVHDFLSAVSVGLVGGELMLDLCYVEDPRVVNMEKTNIGDIAPEIRACRRHLKQRLHKCNDLRFGPKLRLHKQPGHCRNRNRQRQIGKVDNSHVGRRVKFSRRDVPNIGLLHVDNTRILAKLPCKLAVAHINCIHTRRASRQ
jgi:ribonuclease PH